MKKNDLTFLEPLSEDLLGKLKGGFGIYEAKIAESQAAVSNSVSVTGNCSCSCSCKTAAATMVL